MSSLKTALFRKRMVSCGPSEDRLKPVLNAWDLTLLGIGAIIGTGIFVLTGHAAAEQSGPAVILSFAVSGLACAFAALAYAELASCVGGCGSAYGYSYAAFGELIAWIIGWDLVLEYGVSVAAVANGWSGYFHDGLSSIGINIPEFLTKGPFAKDPITNLPDPGIINLPAFSVIIALMGLLIIGVKESARLNTAMVTIKLLAICIFIGAAIWHVDTSLWHPFMPFGWLDTDPATGKRIGILAGASIVFFAYVGFDAVSTAVEETKNPSRDVPIGILGSLAFCTIIYIIVAALLTGIVSYTQLNVSSPASHALQLINLNIAAALVATGVIAGLLAVMLVLYYALTRIIFAMARDGLLPAMFGNINKKTHTPVKTTIICGVLMAILAGFIPLGELAELVNIGTLAAFVLVCGGVIVLRIQQPDMPRPFKTPFGLLIPIMGVLSCSALITFLPVASYFRFALWLAAGMVIYFAYSIRHSKAV
jgi:APA family basic amino acid/polyamine antiporter